MELGTAGTVCARLFGGTIETAYELEYESMGCHNHIFMLAEPDVKCLVHTDVRAQYKSEAGCFILGSSMQILSFEQ